MAASRPLSQSIAHTYDTRSRGAPAAPTLGLPGANELTPPVGCANISGARMVPDEQDANDLPVTQFFTHCLPAHASPVASILPHSDPLRELLARSDPQPRFGTPCDEPHTVRQQMSAPPQYFPQLGALPSMSLPHSMPANVRSERDAVQMEVLQAQISAITVRMDEQQAALQERHEQQMATIHALYMKSQTPSVAPLSADDECRASVASGNSLPSIAPPRPSAAPSVVSLASLAASTTTASGADAYDDLLPSPAATGPRGAVAASIKRADIFTQKELVSMPCTCKPEAVPGWQVMFLGRVEARSGPALKCLQYTDEEVATLPADARAVFRGYDITMGGHLLAVIDADEKNADAALVRTKIADRESEKPGTVASSGRAIWGIINEVITPAHGSELGDLEKKLKKSFFSMRQSAINVKLAAGRLKTLRAQLPEGSRGGERELLKALLKKFPPELAEDAKRFRRKMNESEVRKKPYPWSYSELTAILASLIDDGPDECEANAADGPAVRRAIRRRRHDRHV